MSRARPEGGGNAQWFRIFCPACGTTHVAGAPLGATVDLERPSLGDIVIRSNGPGQPPYACISTIVNGQALFHAECTHAMAGETVDLPELP